MFYVKLALHYTISKEVIRMSEKEGKILFLFFGIIFLLFSILVSIATISQGTFPAGHDILLFGLSIMAFCNSYLYPQIKVNDERAKCIREKGMFVNYIAILSCMAILLMLFEFNLLNLSGEQTVYVLATLSIITVLVSMVIISKRY